MRVCLVSESWAPRVDGVAKSIAVLLEAFDHGVGSEDTFCAVVPRGSTNSLGIAMRVVSAVRTPYDGYALALTTRARMRRTLEELKPDVVHIHTQGLLGVTSLLAAKDLSIPVVTSMHTDLCAYSRRYPSAALFGSPLFALAARDRSISWPITASGAAHSLVELFASHSQAIIVPSEKMAQEVRRQSSVTDLIVLPTPRDLSQGELKSRAEARSVYGLAEDATVVTYLGRLAREKDVALVLRALSVGGGGLDRCQLMVAGSGDQRRRLERLARRLYISQRVRFLGSVNEEQVRTILSATDVLAMPSMTDTQSLVLVEAASLGIPFVVRDERLAMGESIVQHDHSCAVGGSSAEFISALRRMVESPELRRSLGDFAQRHSRDVGAKYAQRLREVYARVEQGRCRR